jgi:hypothetical protein
MSPITYAKNVKTPLLILHSENDLRCPMEQAEQLYGTLKALKKEVEFVRFPRSATTCRARAAPTGVSRAWKSSFAGGRQAMRTLLLALLLAVPAGAQEKDSGFKLPVEEFVSTTAFAVLIVERTTSPRLLLALVARRARSTSGPASPASPTSSST